MPEIPQRSKESQNIREIILFLPKTDKLESEQTVEREFSPLLEIKDNFPKFVVTMDDFWKESLDGIQHFYISDFLLSDIF